MPGAAGGDASPSCREQPRAVRGNGSAPQPTPSPPPPPGSPRTPPQLWGGEETPHTGSVGQGSTESAGWGESLPCTHALHHPLQGHRASRTRTPHTHSAHAPTPPLQPPPRPIHTPCGATSPAHAPAHSRHTRTRPPVRVPAPRTHSRTPARAPLPTTPPLPARPGFHAP